MATFDPQVQPGNQDMPNWTRVTQPASGFEADKSSGLALSNAASSLEGAVSLADTAAKDVIKRDTKNTVEPIREDFTNELINARDQANSVVPAAVQTPQGSTATNVLQDNQTSVQPPNAVKTGLDKIQAVQLAQENGKVNDTYYDMRLKQAVTDLRSKYPGYTDYIDAEVSKITGINPANALIGNLMQDINRLQSNKKSEADKLTDQVMVSGYPNSKMQLQKLQANPNDPATITGVRNWYATEAMKDADLKRRDAVRKAAQGTKEDISDQRLTDFTVSSGAKLSSDMDAIITIPGITTPKKVLDIMADAAAHPENYTDIQLRQLAVQVGAQKAQFISDRQAEARKIGTDDQGRKYSYYGDVGNAKIDAQIDSMGKVYDGITDALTKGGPGGIGIAYQHAIHAKAVLDQGKDALVSDKDIGQDAVNMANMRELFGEQWATLATTETLKQNIDKKMGAFLSLKQQNARLGADSNGNPVTLAQHMDEAKQLEDQGKITAGMRSRYVDKMVNLVDDIKNPNSPTNAKENIVKYIFSPEGQGILNKMKTDYTDPTLGFIPGKYSVFTRLTSEDIVKEIRKMSPEAQGMYKNYLEREAGAEIFQKEIQNLNHFTGHDDIHFKYNDAAKGGYPTLTAVDKDDKPLTASAVQQPYTGESRFGASAPRAPVQYGYVNQINSIVNRINTGLAGMSRVEKAFGGNANEYVLDFLVNRAAGGQLDMSKNFTGLPAKVVDAIAASRAPARRIEDTFNDAKGNK